MDLNIIISSLITGIATLILGYFGAVKAALPKMIESRLTERETKIREEAEASAYERNRKATHEDRTFEMLHDMMEFIQERIEKEDHYRERQLEEFKHLVESLRELGFKYHTLHGNQQITNQHLAIMTDEIKNIRYQFDEKEKQ